MIADFSVMTPLTLHICVFTARTRGWSVYTTAVSDSRSEMVMETRMVADQRLCHRPCWKQRWCYGSGLFGRPPSSPCCPSFARHWAELRTPSRLLKVNTVCALERKGWGHKIHHYQLILTTCSWPVFSFCFFLVVRNFWFVCKEEKNKQP